MTTLYYLDGPACTCRFDDDHCTGCVHARFTSFLRGLSWLAIAISEWTRRGLR